MMLPTEVIALAEARRDAFEHELKLQQRLSLIPARPSPWRSVTGNGLMWAGRLLVRWGNGMAMTRPVPTVESVRQVSLVANRR